MAHFAEIDLNNKVLRVVVACNSDIANNGGEQSEQAAEHFKKVCKLSLNGIKWVQTSINNNFRKQYAGIGHTFDSTKNKFIKPQPFASWSLDSNDDWQAPVVYPTVITYINTLVYEDPLANVNVGDSLNYFITWDESNLRWLGLDNKKSNFAWISESSSWTPINN
jgi:hypothetical protein